MKTFFKTFTLSLLGYLILPTSVLADDPSTFIDIHDPIPPQLDSLGKVITALIPYVIVLAGMVATLLIIWGGFKYMTSQGDQKAVASARATITGAVIGLIIILLIGVIGFIIGQVLHFDIFTGTVVT